MAISNKHARKLFQCIWHLHINSRSSAALSSIKASRLVYEKNETIVSEQANSIVNTNSDDFFRSLTFNMIQQSALLQLFSGLKASDEMFFPTVLSMLRCRNEVIKKRWTYAEWEGQASSPLSFVPAEILKKLANISTAEAEAKSLPEGKSAAASLYQLPLGRFLHPVRTVHYGDSYYDMQFIVWLWFCFYFYRIWCVQWKKMHFFFAKFV